MTMSEQEQLKKKTKKSLEQLIEELSSVTKKMAVVYVPEIAEAIKEKYPDWDVHKTKKKVLETFVENGWNEQYIERVIRLYASWLNEENINHFRTVNSWKTKHLNKLIGASQRFAEETKNIPDPPEPKEPKDKWETIDEEAEADLHKLGLAEFGDTGKTIREILDAIYDNGRGLFKALSQKEAPYSGEVDFIVDYLKPTREFRKSLMLELDKDQRTNIHNLMHYVAELAEDTINMIDEADNK